MSDNKTEFAVVIVATALLVAAKIYLTTKKTSGTSYADKMSRVAYVETKINKIQRAAKLSGAFNTTAYNTFVAHNLTNATVYLELYMLHGQIQDFEKSLKCVHKAEGDMRFFCRVSV